MNGWEIKMNEKKETINAVRQVLMGELGLTRESIREEVKNIIVDTIQKQFNGEKMQSVINQTLKEIVFSMWKKEIWQLQHQVVVELANRFELKAKE